MQSQIDQVRTFHRTHGFSENLTLQPSRFSAIHTLVNALDVYAKQMLAEATKNGEDIPTLRGHLILEEAGVETMEALAEGDELKLLDALSDALYVEFGTAVSFNLPLAQAFNEVHLSNMTKEPVKEDPHRGRLRQKGPHFMKPDLAHILARHRGTAFGPTVLEALDEVCAGLGMPMLAALKHPLTPGQIDIGAQNRIGIVSAELVSLCQRRVHEFYEGTKP